RKCPEEGCKEDGLPKTSDPVHSLCPTLTQGHTGALDRAAFRFPTVAAHLHDRHICHPHPGGSG
ncbi:hypothetical protein P7K49_014248, partial [Saguinus oedipus]